MRRLLYLIALVMVACLPAAMASAQSYQLDSVSTTAPTPGEAIHVHGNGFAPSSSVAAVVACGSSKTTVGSLTASASDGTVDGTVVLPASTPTGTCTLSLVGTNPDGTPRDLSFTLTVEPVHAASTSSGILPFTGATVGPVIAAGVALILVGFSFVSARRRRRAAV